MRKYILPLVLLSLIAILSLVDNSVAQTHIAYVFYYDSLNIETPIEDAEVRFSFSSGTGSGLKYTHAQGLAATTHRCAPDSDSCHVQVTVDADGFDPVNPASGSYLTWCTTTYFEFEMEPSTHDLVRPKEQEYLPQNNE